MTQGMQYGEHWVRKMRRKWENNKTKAEPEVVELEVCENCHQRMRPKGSRCIQCGHDPRRIAATKTEPKKGKK